MLKLLEKDPLIHNLLTRLSKPRANVNLFREGWGGLGPLLALLHSKIEKPMIYIGSSEEKLRLLFGDCSLFTGAARFFPQRQEPPLEDPILEGERTAVLEELLTQKNLFLFCTLRSLLFPVRSAANLKKSTLRLEPGKTFGFQPFLKTLEDWKYRRSSTVMAANEYAVRGGIIDLYPPSSPHPYRLEWLDEKIDSLRIFDPASQRSVQKINTLELFPPEDEGEASSLALDYFPPETLAIGESPEQWEKEVASTQFFDWIKTHSFLQTTSFHSDNALAWPFQVPANFTHHFRSFLEKAREEINRNQVVWIYSRQASRLREVLAENHLDSIVVNAQPLAQGFCLPSQRLQVYTDHELFGRVIGLLPHRKNVPSVPVTLEELKEGELVVHSSHGIAFFDGVTTLSVEGKREDYLTLSFAGNDRLYVPLEDMIQVERYVGPTGRIPPLSKLGGSEWRGAKKKAREAAKAIAKDLVQLYAVRGETQGHAYSPDTPWQAELEEAFPFIETPDQAKAIQETKSDMENSKPMDRLVLGDVGYGKTEVALRAAFKAVMDGKQVAVLVPTTILAQQHYETFTERLTTFPVRVEVLSRFKTRKEIQEILASLAHGEVDVIIGTHRLLQKDVVFKNPGLLVIDEEQRFGVAHKEALKKLKENIDVLTLSATPIPRTLYFSLTGVRDMSVIETPPEDRLPVKTFVQPKDEKLIQQAIAHELKREGQVYYLCNRIKELEDKAKQIHRLVPGARVAIVHGKIKPALLEEIMWEFMKGLYDVLLCTTIIENGLDIPRVNTLLVEESERFGLADLYQLRGRVGRSDRQAYAYFLTSPRNEVTGVALKRLQTIEEFAQLGSGYQIALKDLEFRGAGNLLGLSQHGHIAQIGFHLYCDILAEEVKKIKGVGDSLGDASRREVSPKKEMPKVSLKIPLSAFIPEQYVEARAQKLAIYRRLASSKTNKEVDEILAEMVDRFGPPPEEVLNLIEMVKLKIS